MTAAARLDPYASWPLLEQARHFDLGHILNSAIADALEPDAIGALGVHHAGLWECNLEDNALIWSGGVYDMFGLERGSPITREMALAHYRHDSLAKLERLRTFAIQNRRGFTLDVEIDAGSVGECRWIRLIGAPVCEGDALVRLHGLKLII